MAGVTDGTNKKGMAVVVFTSGMTEKTNMPGIIVMPGMTDAVFTTKTK